MLSNDGVTFVGAVVVAASTVFWRRHHGDLPYCAALDHRDHLTSGSAHFPGVVVHAEPGIFKVLVREQDLLSLREEKPGFADAQGDVSPLVGLQPKSQVSILCNL